MAILIVHGPAGTTEFPLADPVTVIGRGETADVRVLDPGISREHCRIVRVGEAYRLEDAGSRNGTVVNGSTTREHPLSPGDEISLGKFRIVFDPPRQEEAAAPEPADAEARESIAMAPAEADPSRDHYVLELLTGRAKGTTFDLSNDVMIGSDPSCGIRLDMGGVAPRQAKLIREHETWFIEDIAGGMMVGGRKALKAHLTTGMTVVFGNAQLLFKNLGVAQEMDVAPRTLMLADTAVMSFADLKRKTVRRQRLAYVAVAISVAVGLAILAVAAVLLLR